MPIFEYVCQQCQKQFEAVVYGSSEPKCPACESTQLEKQLSTFAVGAARPSASSRPPMGGCGGGGCGGGSCPMN